MRLLIRSFRAAIFFLTRIPVGGDPYSEPELRWSAAHFPAVGALLGVMYGTFCWALGPYLPEWSIAWLVIGLTCLITGGFHEDGLADTADALGGAYNKERLFEILKDSRIGTFGTLAVVVTLATKASVLAHLFSDTPSITQCLFLFMMTQTISRVFPVFMMSFIPYATPDAASKSRLIIGSSIPQAMVALLWTLAFTAGGIHFYPEYLHTILGAAAACLIFNLFLSAYFIRRAGGVTGDFLGATQQLNEVLIWLFITALAS